MNETKTATEVLEVAIGGGTLRSLLCDHHTKLALAHLSGEHDRLQWTLNTLEGGGACEECCALPQRGDTLVQRLERAVGECATAMPPDATLPAADGFYWVRIRSAPATDERVALVSSSLGSTFVTLSGTPAVFAVSDFEWLEGPIRRKT